MATVAVSYGRLAKESFFREGTEESEARRNSNLEGWRKGREEMWIRVDINTRNVPQALSIRIQIRSYIHIFLFVRYI